MFHAKWRERHDLTAKHLSTQQRTADPVIHENWKERPNFTAKHLSTPNYTADPILHGNYKVRFDFTARHLTQNCTALLSKPFMETRENGQILRQSI